MDRCNQEIEQSPRSQPQFERWPWSEALAAARPGVLYRIARIPSSLARGRMRELGCGEGDVFVFLGNREGIVRLPLGRRGHMRLERGLAWFVQVEPLASIGPLAN